MPDQAANSGQNKRKRTEEASAPSKKAKPASDVIPPEAEVVVQFFKELNSKDPSELGSQFLKKFKLGFRAAFNMGITQFLEKHQLNK